METIDNSLLKVNDEVWLQNISHSWIREPVYSIEKATITKITKSRLYVELENKKVLNFDYKKTKRLIYKEKHSIDDYILYHTKAEIERIDEHRKKRSELQEKVKIKMTRDIKRLSNKKLEQLLEIMDNL